MATSWRLKRALPGVRTALAIPFALVGAALTYGAVGLAAYLPFAVVHAFGLPFGVGVPFSLAGLGGAFIVGSRLVGEGIVRIERFRSPWGRIVVGDDGVRWDGWWGRHFRSWREVAATEPMRDGLRLRLARGADVELHPDDVATVEAAITAARAVYETSPVNEPPRELEPERDAARTLERARALRTADYRSGSAPETIVDVAVSPTAPPVTRALAALAVGDDAARAKVRAALERVADEELAEAMALALADRLSPAHVERLRKRSR